MVFIVTLKYLVMIFLMDCIYMQPYFESIVLLVKILLKPYVSQYNCYNFEIHEYDD